MNFVIIKGYAINTENVFSVTVETAGDEYELVISSNGATDNTVRVEFDDLGDAERALMFIATESTGQFHESL